MRLLAMVILSGFSLQTFAGANMAPPPETLVQVLEINCNYLRNSKKSIQAVVWGLADENRTMRYADVTLVREVPKQKEPTKKTYKMDYLAPAGMSLYFKFENKEEKTKLEAFGDDMGGMSSLTIGKRSYELTCSIDEI